mmetsp:Transcript_3213/g.4580  ORF Transcript_3213/g.4580 Transcript_3213/m.4580 type:complete len:103 (+) Transcript_3213:52-360(+)
MESLSSNQTATSPTVVVVEKKETQEKENVLILKLRTKPNLRWAEDTIDNENQGKKSSKRCCIFHKNKAFGESDSEESESDTETARKKDIDPRRVKNFQRFHA